MSSDDIALRGLRDVNLTNGSLSSGLSNDAAIGVSFSAVALLILTLSTLASFSILVGLSLRELPGCMPLGSNSMAVSACCAVLPKSKDFTNGRGRSKLEEFEARRKMSLEKLKWGVGHTLSAVSCDILDVTTVVKHLGFGTIHDGVEAPLDGEDYLLGNISDIYE